jgi:hypothetical protein
MVRAFHLCAAVVALQVTVCIHVSGTLFITAAAGSKHAHNHNKNEQETKDSCFHGFFLLFSYACIISDIRSADGAVFAEQHRRAVAHRGPSDNAIRSLIIYHII